MVLTCVALFSLINHSKQLFREKVNFLNFVAFNCFESSNPTNLSKMELKQPNYRCYQLHDELNFHLFHNQTYSSRKNQILNLAKLTSSIYMRAKYAITKLTNLKGILSPRAILTYAMYFDRLIMKNTLFFSKNVIFYPKFDFFFT